MKYVFQFGNESGTEAEVNTSKAIRTALRYETRFRPDVPGQRLALPSRGARRLGHGRGAGRLPHARGRAGVEYAYQFREHGDFSTTPDITQRVASAFGVVDAKPQKISVFARLDFYQDPCPKCADLNYLPIDPTAPFTFGLAGVEFFIHPSVRISPNVEWVSYGTPAAAGAPPPKNDVVFRMTFFWSW